MGSVNSVTTLPIYPGGTQIPSLNGGSFPIVQQHGSVSYSSSSPGIGLGILTGGLLELLVLLILVGIIGTFVILIVSNRAEPDPSGNRPRSVYFFAVSLVTLTVGVNASIAMVVALVLLIGHHQGSIANGVARAELLAGLFAIVSMGLFVRHLRRGVDLALVSPEPANPSKRVGQSYVGVVAFVSVISFLLSIVASVYFLFSIAAPGVFGSLGGRVDAARALVVALYIALVAVTIFLAHRNLVPPGLFGAGGAGLGGVGRPAPATPVTPVD